MREPTKLFTCLFASSLLVALSASPAVASNTNGFAPLSGVYGTSIGAVLFSAPSSNRTGIPTCGQSNPGRWAIDASTPAGQAAVAVLLSAWAAKKQVWVNGTGTCSIWGDTETVSYFNIQD